MAIGRFTTTRRIVIATLLAGGALVAGLAPATARWQVHNSNDVTQILAPKGATEAQTCTDQLHAQSGWSTFVPNSDDLNNYVPPPGSGAYGPVGYDFWKAPTGYTSGSFRESDVTPGTVDFLPDGATDPVPAILVRNYTTPPRAQVSPPEYLYPDQVDTDPNGGNLYLFSRSTWNALLPGLHYGDLMGIKPSGSGSTFINLTAIECGASKVHIRFVRYNPAGPDTTTNNVLNQEIVRITNGSSQARQLGGWTLGDNGGNEYTFPATRLDPGQSVGIHSGRGTNRAGQLYWGRTSFVWGNHGDTAVLRNSSGTKVDSCRWGSGPGWVYC